jgi:hypothetical protein
MVLIMVDLNLTFAKVKPKELDVEQAVKRVVEKLSDMGATSNSSGASGSIARGTPGMFLFARVKQNRL